MTNKRKRLLIRLRWLERRRKRRDRKKAGGRKRKTNSGFRDFFIGLKERDVASITGKKELINGQWVPKGVLVLTMPEVFDFESNYEQSARLIAVFRRALENLVRIRYIDFSRMHKASVACAVVFTCYADLWKHLCVSVRPVTNTWHPGIRELFSQLGFFKAMRYKCETDGVGISTSPYVFKDLRGYFITNESRNLSQFAKDYPAIRADMESLIGGSLNDIARSYYCSISEAVTNIYHHAYDKVNRSWFFDKWWISIAFDKTANELVVIVFDHGKGIPATAWKTKMFSSYMRFSKELDEFLSLRRLTSEIQRKVLFLVFEQSASIARKQGRGHGCADIKSLLGNIKGGKLSVISLQAKYENGNYKGNKSVRGESKSLAVPLQGTLLEWRIPL